MKGADRKAAIAAYKERKTPVGVFAVRCSASGQVWVGASRHLDTHKTGLWVGLKHNGYPHPGLQKAFNEHGEATFSFEALEELPGDLSAYEMQSRLKDRAAHWRDQLGATAI